MANRCVYCCERLKLSSNWHYLPHESLEDMLCWDHIDYKNKDHVCFGSPQGHHSDVWIGAKVLYND